MEFLRKTVLISICLIGSYLASDAAIVDTVETYSPSMAKKIKAVVIRPEAYAKLGNLPVVYLLHGYGGNYSSWIKNMPELTELADRYGMMLVCPDGNVSSWYLNSPIRPEWKYETYISIELVDWIDGRYKTIRDRKGRAISGYSMGGHGAMYLSFKHQDVFGAAGSTSGGVDIRPFPNNWKMADLLGTYAQMPANWEANAVINMVHLLTPGKIALIIDCGTEDFFYKVNLDFHKLLLDRNIPHDFYVRPGGHKFTYWKNAMDFQLLFFDRFFKAKP